MDSSVGRTTQGQAGLSLATSPFKPPTPPPTKPWPSPLSTHSSSSGSATATIPIYSPGSSRGMTAFLDHMDIEPNEL